MQEWRSEVCSVKRFDWLLLALKMEGATGQGIQTASKDQEKQGKSPRNLPEGTSPTDTLALAHETCVGLLTSRAES